MQPILIYGGSFDPIHDGHLKTAEAVHTHLNADKTLFVPCKQSVLKENSALLSTHRVAMLKLALEPYPNFEVDFREINRETPSYMIETLASIRAEFGNTRPMVFVLGLDAFVDFMQWHRWQDILSISHLLVMTRNLNDKINMPPLLQAYLMSHESMQKEALLTAPAGKIYRYNAGLYSVSATYLREHIHIPNHPAQHQLPASVLAYIRDNGLYGIKSQHA
jgi:nicotinate-nucleotide adenylyltransferase